MSQPDKLNDTIVVTQADLDEVSDNPEWTEETAARSRSFTEMFPDIIVPAQVTLRLVQRVIDHYRSAGDDWQKRMNEVLSRAAGF